MVNLKKKKLERRTIIKDLLRDRKELLVVSGLGSPTYDVHFAGDHDQNFYLWGGMGGSAMIGLGLALAQPKRKVMVITGDGEQLMGLGSLATIGIKRPDNLSIIILDNGHFGETGMQVSHTSMGVDLLQVALGAGFLNTFLIQDQLDFENFLEKQKNISNCSFAVIKISPDQAKRSIPLVDGQKIKERFKKSIGLD